MKLLKRQARFRRRVSSRGRRFPGTRTARLAKANSEGSRRGIRPRVRRPRHPTRVKPARRRRPNATTAQHPIVKLRTDPQYQILVRNFGVAARFFQKQNYVKAMEIFEKLTNASSREVAERARVHLQLCEQKLGRAAPAPKTAEDYYSLGVAELNARNFDLGIKHLRLADKLEPHQEHTQYALAAGHALQGNVEAALEHLKAAIALRPENRFHARRDEDFQFLAADPRFKRLVHVEASESLERPVEIWPRS